MDVQAQLRQLREKRQELKEKSWKRLQQEEQEKIREEIRAVEAEIQRWEHVEKSAEVYLQDPEIKKKLVREERKKIEEQTAIIREMRNPMNKEVALTAPIPGMNREQRRKELKELRRRKKRSRQRPTR